MRIRLPRGFTAFLGALLIRLLGLTWRVRWEGMENIEAARRISPQVIFSFWHGRLLVLSYSHRGRKIQVLASEHEDGDLMGRAITWLGFGHRKGSTSRGGARALRELAKVLGEGLDIGLTVDGPRGPRGALHQGAVELSRMTGSAIVPVSNSSRPRKLFSSWDRFQLPTPFAKVTVAYGEPMFVPKGSPPEERERLRIELEARLNDLTALLDVALGYEGTGVWPHADN
jgi:lysophospholipid acyltransferase (LPLAT)-like uncharacterized protein